MLRIIKAIQYRSDSVVSICLNVCVDGRLCARVNFPNRTAASQRLKRERTYLVFQYTKRETGKMITTITQCMHLVPTSSTILVNFLRVGDREPTPDAKPNAAYRIR